MMSTFQFDLIKPDLYQCVITKQVSIPSQKGKENESSSSVQSCVFVKNFSQGTIARASGPQSLIVNLVDG